MLLALKLGGAAARCAVKCEDVRRDGHLQSSRSRSRRARCVQPKAVQLDRFNATVKVLK